MRDGGRSNSALTLCPAASNCGASVVKTRFAAHAYPRLIHYADALPKTPSGKTQRFIVRQQLKERVEAGTKGD